MASFSGQNFAGSIYPERMYEAEYRDTLGNNCTPQYRLGPNSGYIEAYGERGFYGPSGSDTGANISALGVRNNFSSGVQMEQQMSSSPLYLDSQKEGRLLAKNDDDLRDRRQYSPTYRSSLTTEGGANFVDQQWHSDYVPYRSSVNSMDNARSVGAIGDRDFRQSHRMRPSPVRESTVYDNRRTRDSRRSRSPRRHDKYSSKPSDQGHSDSVSRHDEKSSKSKDERYSVETSGRKNKYSKSSDRGFSDDKDHDRRSSDYRDRERKTYREDAGYGDEQDKLEHRVSCSRFKVD